MLLVPRIDGSYAAIGVLGSVEQVGRLADGDPGALIRGRRPRADRRRHHRAGRRAVGRGHRGSTRAVPEPLPGPVAELVKEYKALATDWLRKRGAWQVVDRVQQIDDVSPLADNSGYSPFLTTEQKIELLETADPVGPAEARHRAAARAPRRAGRRRVHRQGRPGRRRQAAARVPAAPPARGRTQGAARAQRRAGGRGVRRLPRPRRGRRPAREGARGRAQGGRQAGAVQRPVARGLLDPHLARHRPRTAVERADRGRRTTSRAPRPSWTPSTPACRT